MPQDKTSGHRQRLKKRLMTEGLENFEPYNVLELLLFYSYTRIDTKPIAYALLDKFGTVSDVLEAPYEELVKVDGVGENTATLIGLIPQLFRYYKDDQSNKSKNKVILNSVTKAGNYLLPKYIGRTNEVVYLICLGPEKEVLFCDIIEEGVVNATNITIRKIAEIAMRVGASGIILSHNHPQGVALPSRQDIQTTRSIKDSLKNLSIELIDHIIVDKDDFVSMGQSKML